MTAAEPDQVVIRRVRNIDADLEERWWRLAERAAEPNPFTGPGVVLAAAEHLAGADQALLVTVERDGELTFVLPVVRTRLNRRIPMPVLDIWQEFYPPLGGPLVDPDHGVAAWRAVRTAMATQLHVAWLVIDPMTSNGPVAAMLAEAVRTGGPGAPPRMLETVPRAVMFQDSERIRPSEKTQKSLESRRRKLGRMAGEPARTIEVAPGDPVPDELVEEFLALEAGGWKGRAGTALASDDSQAAFFRAMIRRHAERKAVQVIGIRCGDRLVAATFNLVAGDGLFFYKIAYNEEYHACSPGRILMADNVNMFADTPRFTVADSCADPTAALSNQVLHDRRPVSTMLIPAAGVSAGLLTQAAMFARDARRRRRARIARRADAEPGGRRIGR